MGITDFGRLSACRPNARGTTSRPVSGSLSGTSSSCCSTPRGFHRHAADILFSRAVDSGALVVRPLHLRRLPLDARELDLPLYQRVPLASHRRPVLRGAGQVQTLMLQADVLALQDPNYIPDSGSGVYIIFLIISLHRLFHDPHRCRVGDPVGRSRRGYGRYRQGRGIRHGCRAGGIAGNMIGRTFGRRGGGGSSSGNGGGGPASGSAPNGRNLATQGNSNHS